MKQRWIRWIAWGAAVVIGALADRSILTGGAGGSGWWWTVPGTAALVGTWAVLRPRTAGWGAFAAATGFAALAWGALDSSAPLSVSLYLLAVGSSAASARDARSSRDALAVVAGAGAVVLSLAGTVRSYSEWVAVIGSGFVPWGAAVALAVTFRQMERNRDQAVVLARTEERLALARELHDVVGHHLTGIVLVAQGARLAAPHDAVSRSLLSDIEAAGVEALDATRRVVSSLRSAQPGESTNLDAELDSILSEVEAGGVVVHRDCCAVPAALAPTVIALTREACTNVRRHAPGVRSVALRVVDDGSDLVWELVDDGLATESAGARGWDPSMGFRSSGFRSVGFGLLGMEERVTALGGSFSAGPLADGGWRVAARLPGEVVR